MGKLFFRCQKNNFLTISNINHIIFLYGKITKNISVERTHMIFHHKIGTPTNERNSITDYSLLLDKSKNSTPWRLNKNNKKRKHKMKQHCIIKDNNRQGGFLLYQHFQIKYMSQHKPTNTTAFFLIFWSGKMENKLLMIMSSQMKRRHQSSQITSIDGSALRHTELRTQSPKTIQFIQDHQHWCVPRKQSPIS